MQVEVAVKDIVVDPEINFRDGLDPEVVERYKESGRMLPPVTVFLVDGQLLLADGFHRLEALKQLGVERVVVDQHPGDKETARGRAAIANVTHGKPLTREERNRAVVWLYNYGLPTADIARHFALSESMVSRIATEAGARRRDLKVAQKGVATRRAKTRASDERPDPATVPAGVPPAPGASSGATPVAAPVERDDGHAPADQTSSPEEEAAPPEADIRPASTPLSAPRRDGQPTPDDSTEQFMLSALVEDELKLIEAERHLDDCYRAVDQIRNRISKAREALISLGVSEDTILRAVKEGLVPNPRG